MAERVHPSEFIQDELDARGWSLDELAVRMGGSAPHNRLALDLYMEVGAGEKDLRLGMDMAAQLAAAFETSAELWLNLERQWLSPRITHGTMTSETTTPSTALSPARNAAGRLGRYCSKAGSEECDWECPYSR